MKERYKVRLNNKLLRDVMTRGVVTVPMDATAKQIATLLSKQRLSAVAVIGHDCDLMGLISDMDMLKVIGQEGWESISAETMMTSHVETVKPTTTLGDAAKIMREKHIHRLIVFSEKGVGASQRPIGVLSASDIIREAARA
jgi:predicted transcriptional regulator